MAPIARTREPELLDQLGASVPPAELASNLRDIRRVNRWLGGTRAVLSVVVPLLRAADAVQPISILDVATGSADIPLALAAAAEREGRKVRIVATDREPAVLDVARAEVDFDLITIEVADALALPYPDASFDIVTLSLALHHFDLDDALQVLREMRRVGREALIVNDLERVRLGYIGAWLAGNLLTRNRMTRNDAPLSVRRAYTRAEALAMAHSAGWHAAHVRPVAPFRYLLTGRSA